MISIIIPTFNEERIIKRTLLSLRKLSAFEYEIIVSDGYSTDRTTEIANKYADKVIVYDGTIRPTISTNRNNGVKIAKGDFLLFLDADVYIPDIDVFLKKVLDYFKNNINTVGVTVPLKVFPEIATSQDNFFYSILNIIIYINNNILHRGAASGKFQIVRMSAFKKIGGFNEKLVAGEDFEMFNRLSGVGRTYSIESLYVYHTGRRPHRIGWIKLLSLWFMNWLYSTFLKKSWSTLWKEIR